MKSILSARQMRECDHSTIAHGTSSAVLMQRAGFAVYQALINNFDISNTLIICGSGNNGGDGFIVALYLKRAGYSCDIWYVGDGHAMTEECEKRFNECVDADIPFVESPLLFEYSAIVDAIFGTGLSSSPEGLSKTAIEAVKTSGIPVISIDIPSGISADTGISLGSFIRADVTVAIQAFKIGHILSDGIDASGKLICADIGIDTSYAVCTDSVTPFSVEDTDLKLIPRRKRDSHKGNYGRVLVIAGSTEMCGAAYLSAAAAYRTGAGIVEIFTAKENRTALCTLLPEAIITSYDTDTDIYKLLTKSIDRATVIVIGPGIGTSDIAKRIVAKTYEISNSPIIIDADALNITASEGFSYPNEVPVIITPHPMELSRLTKKSVKELTNDIWGSAIKYAKENGIICVSKYSRTVITDGEAIFVNGKRRKRRRSLRNNCRPSLQRRLPH